MYSTVHLLKCPFVVFTSFEKHQVMTSIFKETNVINMYVFQDIMVYYSQENDKISILAKIICFGKKVQYHK